MELDMLEFKADYAADSEKSFVVMTRDGLKSPDVVDFQVEMISKTKIPGVLQFYLREIDMEMRFYYNVTGLINLSNFLRRRSINKDEFIEILEGITSTLMQSKRYLLTDRCFLLKENFIYIDPVRLKTHLIYIPVDNKSDLFRSFKTLVNNLLLDCANIDTNDNFVQKVLGIFKEDRVCLNDFLTQLKRLKSTAGSSGKDYSGYGNQSYGNQSCDKESSTELKLSREKSHFSRALEARQPISHTRSNEAVSDSSFLNLPTVFGVGLIGLMAGLLFYGRTVSLSNGFPKFLQQHSILAGAAIVAVFTAAVLYLKIVKPYLVRDFSLHAGLSQSAASSQGSHHMDNSQSQLPLQSLFDDGIGTSKSEVPGKINNSDTINNLDVTVNDNARTHTNMNPPGTNADETVLLSELKQPMLISVCGRNKILLNKSELVIGRNKEMCDCVIENRGVGRAHARIVNTKGKCLVTDLDSTNGTFINGTKLISNKEYELKYNDRVLFANAEYCLRLE